MVVGKRNLMENKTKKLRLDLLLVDLKVFETRQKAQSAIMSGQVYVNDKQITKAGTQVLPTDKIVFKGEKFPYVSRGGLKLARALSEFNISVKDKICLDAGASTGGFTDCLLQHEAKLVYAVDVGYGQFDWKLRNDPRVKLIERENIRYLTREKLYNNNLENMATFCCMDLSFISVTKVLQNVVELMDTEKHIVILIKPQFEAGKDQVPKSGVIKGKDIYLQVIDNIFQFCDTISLKAISLTYSPIKGSSGNIEFLAYLNNIEDSKGIALQHIVEIVDQAQQELI